MLKSREIPSQLLNNAEKRMTTSVSRINAALARNIERNWVSEPYVMIDVELEAWRRSIFTEIYRYGENLFAQGSLHVFTMASRKNDPVESLLALIRPQLVDYSRTQAALITRYLRARITKELATGATQAQIRDRITSIITGSSVAASIARNEAHTALERGAYEAALSLGVNIRKTWITRADSLVRSYHAAAHGQTVNLLTPFVVDGESMMFPGDPNASARNRANCRCGASYELV